MSSDQINFNLFKWTAESFDEAYGYPDVFFELFGL